jgi:hypothetical protein
MANFYKAIMQPVLLYGSDGVLGTHGGEYPYSISWVAAESGRDLDSLRFARDQNYAEAP